MNIYPIQSRFIDPYASFSSNSVSALTRVVTRGTNCLHSTHAIDVIFDSTSPLTAVIVTPGEFFKDDILFNFTNNFRVDLTAQDFYASGPAWNEAGYYYLCIAYTYLKAIPPVKAAIKIIKPSQKYLFNTGFLFIKCLQVSFNGATFQLDDLLDFDPSDTTVKRIFSQVYVGTEFEIPAFEQLRDEGRVIYVKSTDSLYYGTSQRWEEFSAVRDNMTTTLCSVGQLAYVHSSGEVRPAIATAIETFADCAVLQIGDGETGDGKVRLVGRVDNVPIETIRQGHIHPGQKLYLSTNEEGAVTNVITEPYSQYVGVCIDSSAVTSCTMWFMTGGMSSGGSGGMGSLYDRYQDLLLASIFKRLSVDAFNNDDYIDTAETTAELDTTNYQIVGDIGEYFTSKSLTDPGFDGTCITHCQLSSSASSYNDSDIQWFVSNDGGLNWEFNELDRLHAFSTKRIPTTYGTGWFTAGSWVQGSVSGKRGVVRNHTSSCVLVTNETLSSNWVVGETLVEDITGLVALVIGIATPRAFCIDIRVKALFYNSQTIQDYGIIYEVDTTTDETTLVNELNIETLYADMYEVPSINSDGFRIHPFADTTAIPTIQIISRTDTITGAIVKLGNSMRPGVGIISRASSTPSISAGNNVWAIADSSSTLSITMFNGAYNGQVIVVVHSGGGAVTIVDGSHIHLFGGINYIMGIYDTITLVYINSSIGWLEVTRSNN